MSNSAIKYIKIIYFFLLFQLMLWWEFLRYSL